MNAQELKKRTIILTEGQIEAIINGRQVEVSIGENESAVIMQSILKDMAAPIINEKYQVMDKDAVNRRIEYARNFDLGC